MFVFIWMKSGLTNVIIVMSRADIALVGSGASIILYAD